MEPNNEIEIRSLIGDLHIESREAGTVSRTIVGYAAKFESWSEPIMGWFREKIARGAFDGCDVFQPQHRFDPRPHDERDAAIGSGRRRSALRVRGSEYDFRERYAGAGTPGRRLEMFVPLRRRAGRVAVCRRAKLSRDGRADDTPVLACGRCVARGISCLSRNRSLGAVSRRAESRVFALVTGWRSGRRNICGAYCSAI